MSRSPKPNHCGPTAVDSGSVDTEFLLHVEGFIGATPALFLVDAATEGVHHGVEIGAHPQAEQRDVVTGVADDRDLRRRVVRPKRCEQSAQESRTPDATGESDDAPRRFVKVCQWHAAVAHENRSSQTRSEAL